MAGPGTEEEGGFTVVHGLAARGMTDRVLGLFKAGWGAAAFASDQWGCTALHHAAQGGHTALVEALLNEGLPLHQRDSSGQTALLAATEKGRVDTVELLLLRGADPNMSDKMGVAALHVVVALKEEGEEGGDAARGARMRLVKLLLAQGADLNQGDALAFTPLHVAAERGRAEEAEALCGAGADPEVRNGYAQTPVEVAEASGASGMGEDVLEAVLRGIREGSRR
ncbi:ankyrin repeat-containing domain protein, partial [Baffinella frigidus]